MPLHYFADVSKSRGKAFTWTLRWYTARDLPFPQDYRGISQLARQDKTGEFRSSNYQGLTLEQLPYEDH